MEAVVQQYLKHLRLEREAPSINYLQRLIQHHLSLVPYETFSKFHYFLNGPDPVPALPDFVNNLTERGWGGTCFTLNMNFARLLSELGFDCSLVRVKPAHLAIMVHHNGKRLYVDVGYGSPIIKPVELENKHCHVLHGFGEEIIFTHTGPREYEIDRRSNGKSFVKKTIKWAPLSEEDLSEDIDGSYADQDENITMRRITAVRFNGHQCFFLRNTTMKVMTYRNISEFQINELEKWVNLVHEVYHIDKKSMEPALDFLKNRGVNLF